MSHIEMLSASSKNGSGLVPNANLMLAMNLELPGLL
jgi:hypothetical protein